MQDYLNIHALVSVDNLISPAGMGRRRKLIFRTKVAADKMQSTVAAVPILIYRNWRLKYTKLYNCS
jgi:hypothetical protein